MNNENTYANATVQAISDVLTAPPIGDWGWYLYGVSRRDHPGEPELIVCAGLDGNPVETLTHRALEAIVSILPLEELGTDALRGRVQSAGSVAGWLEEMVRGHERVVEAVQGERTVLPAKFGCIYASALSLSAALEQAYDTLLAQLQRLDGCDEWGIKLYADRPSIQGYATARDPEARQIEQQMAIAGPGRAYFLKRKLADVVEAATDHSLFDLAQAGYDRLARHARAREMSPLPDTPRSSGTNVEVLRAAFLVPRDGADGFVEEAHRFTESQEGLRCEYSGPWPPYSFVSLDKETLR